MNHFHIFLWSIVSAMNLGQIIRSCYVLGNEVVTLSIFDHYGVYRQQLHLIDQFSSFYSDRYPDVQIYNSEEQACARIKLHTGRVIRTTVEQSSATRLDRFTFRSNDMVIFGNEQTGLPPTAVACANEALIIPMLGEPYMRLESSATGVAPQCCLGLSASVAIVLFTALRDINGFHAWHNE